MRLFISSDIEGVAGVAGLDETRPGAPGYEAARTWMTREVAAAADAAVALGVTEVVVADSHGPGTNLLPDLLPTAVTLVRGHPRPHGMMQGVADGTYVGALLLGYHASAQYGAGVLRHTFRGGFREVRLNGRPVSEAGFNAAVAAHFGVRVLGASGDDAAIAEITAMVGPIEAAVVKTSLSWSAVRTMVPEAGRAAVAAMVRRVLAAPPAAAPAPPTSPVRLELDLHSHGNAELLAWLSCVERVGPNTIAYTGADMAEVVRFTQFVGRYRADLL
jgi:D-amino peptidase